MSIELVGAHSNGPLTKSEEKNKRQVAKKGSIGLYVDKTILSLIDSAKATLGMNRSEFIRFCVMHVLDESNALRTRLKEGLLNCERLRVTNIVRRDQTPKDFQDLELKGES